MSSVAAVLVLRAMMTDDIASSGLTACLHIKPGPEPSPCGDKIVAAFRETWFDAMRIGQLLILGLPALVGVFVGAPLFAREFEQGTHPLAFTQSVSRTRWMANKVLVTVLPALLAVVVMQLVVGYWVDAAGMLGPLRLGLFVVAVVDAIYTDVRAAYYPV